MRRSIGDRLEEVLPSVVLRVETVDWNVCAAGEMFWLEIGGRTVSS